MIRLLRRCASRFPPVSFLNCETTTQRHTAAFIINCQHRHPHMNQIIKRFIVQDGGIGRRQWTSEAAHQIYLYSQLQWWSGLDQIGIFDCAVRSHFFYRMCRRVVYLCIKTLFGKVLVRSGFYIAHLLLTTVHRSGGARNSGSDGSNLLRVWL